MKNLPNLVRYGVHSLLGYAACSRVRCTYTVFNLLLSSSGPSTTKFLAAGSSETSVCIYFRIYEGSHPEASYAVFCVRRKAGYEGRLPHCGHFLCISGVWLCASVVGSFLGYVSL